MIIKTSIWVFAAAFLFQKQINHFFPFFWKTYWNRLCSLKWVYFNSNSIITIITIYYYLDQQIALNSTSWLKSEFFVKTAFFFTAPTNTGRAADSQINNIIFLAVLVLKAIT